MKPAPFSYFAPTTIEEALQLLHQHGDDARPLAGGQSLVPVLNFRLAQPAVLIDLNRVQSLAGVRTVNGSLRIGAMTRQRAIERDDRVARLAPLLSETLPHVAHPQIRNRGTLGGSLAHADPAAELPATMLALGAALRLRSHTGERVVTADDFFTGIFSTALATGELLVEVEIPAAAPRTGCAFEEVSRRHGDFALFGVAAVVSLGTDGSCVDARLAAVSTAVGATRLRGAESSLPGHVVGSAVADEAARLAADEVDVTGDVHASPAYRRQLARVLTARALRRAVAAAGRS